jgi:hypothetical protein
VPGQEISTRASSWSAHIEENKQNQLFNHRGLINSHGLSLCLFLFTKNKEDEGSRPALQHALRHALASALLGALMALHFDVPGPLPPVYVLMYAARITGVILRRKS